MPGLEISFLRTIWYSILEMGHHLFSKPPVVGHLDHKPFFAVVNKAAVNILVDNFLCPPMVTFSEVISMSGIFMLPFHMEH